MTKETVETVYGSVEVDTVDCDSCGETILRDGAYRFGMDTSPNKRMNDVEYNGYACEHCAKVGPASFPERVVSSDRDSVSLREALMLIVWFPIASPIISLLILVDGPRKNDVASGYAYAFIGLLLWGLLTYLFIL